VLAAFLAGDGEFEGLRTGRCKGEISKIHGRECAGRIGIFVADGPTFVPLTLSWNMPREVVVFSPTLMS